MNKQVKSVLLSIAPIIVIIIAGYYILPVSMPIIFALFTAIMFESLVRYVMKVFKCSRRLSVTMIHIVFFIFIIFISYFTFTILLKQVIALSKALPEHFNTLFTLYIEAQTKLFNWTNDWPIEVVQMLQRSLQHQLSSLTTSLTQMTELERYSSIVVAAPNAFLILFVYFTVLYLIQLQLPTLKELFLRTLNPAVAKKVQIVFGELKSAVSGFFKAQIIISGIIAIISLPSLFFILPKYALLLTLGIIFIDSIPFLDSFLLLAPLALILFASGQTRLALLILALGVVLMLVRRFLEPKLLGSQLNLPTLPTFIAMFIGLKLFGVIGLLAGPLVVILIRALLQQKLIKM